jgi:hypothetical protein
VTASSKATELYSADRTTVLRGVKTPESSLHWFAVCGLVSIGIILRLSFFQGYSDSDPHEYTILADQFSRGDIHLGPWDGPIHFPVRFAIYVPAALVFKLFGVSEFAIALVPLLVSVGNMVLAYLLARRIFNSWAGLISVALLCAIPVDITMATSLWPDPIAAFWANVGVALLVSSFFLEIPNYSAATKILAGFFFGIAWLGKETVIYYGPFVAICCFLLAFQKTRSFTISSLALVGSAALVVLGAEAWIYHAYAGDWLFHFRSIEDNFKDSSVWWFDQSSPYFGWPEGEYAKALAKRLIIAGPKAILSSFSKLPLFAMVAIAWAFFVKDRRFVLPAIWLLSLTMMFNFASTSPFEYKPLPLWERYLYPILLPSSILVGGALVVLWQARGTRELVFERRFWACILLAALSLSCLSDAGRLRSRPEQVVRDVLPKLGPTDLVYTDNRSASTLVFLRTGKLSQLDDRTIPYEDISPAALKSGAYVFINKSKLDFLSFSYQYKPPAFVLDPPKTWQSVWSEKGAALFRIE